MTDLPVRRVFGGLLEPDAPELSDDELSDFRVRAVQLDALAAFSKLEVRRLLDEVDLLRSALLLVETKTIAEVTEDLRRDNEAAEQKP